MLSILSFKALREFKKKKRMQNKIQRPLKVINEVEDESEVCGTYGSKDIVQLPSHA